MLTKNEMLRMLIGLKEVNDLDLVASDAVLAASCHEADNATVRMMASIVEEIYDGFDYELSPEFLSRVNGKSAQVQAMHRKLLDNEKLNEAKKRLAKAMARLLEVDEVYKLVAVTDHHRLDELKRLTESPSLASQ